MKRILSAILILFSVFFAFSQTISDTQILKTDHWLYDCLDKLCKEQKIAVFNENSMLSAGEIKFYFSKINYETLSEAGRKNYDKINAFLYQKTNFIQKINDITQKELMDASVFRLDFNILANPELYFKSNENIPWSFRYYYHDNFLTMPLQFAFADYITIEADPFVGKSHYGAALNDSFCNIPFNNDQTEFMFIKHAYGSAGYYSDKWGANLTVGKQGLELGNTKLPSIIYSQNFETDGYLQLNLFTNSFKYSMDIVQVDYQKFLYLHQIDLILFKKIKFSLIEGSQAVDSLQLRFLNPFMFMHQMSAWNDYSPDGSPYGEQRFCAYFCWLLELNLIKNTRLYVLYAQNEIQPPWEKSDGREVGNLYPNSFGIQLGADISIPYHTNGYWNISFEGVYTSPYLYVKHTPQASLYRSRKDNLSGEYVKSWIGSPYGPDSIGVQLGFEYENIEKWKAGFAYLYTMKGEHDFLMFEQKSKSKNSDYGTDDYYSYYPAVAYKLDDEQHSGYDDMLDDATNLLPSGIIEFTNQIVLNGTYKINKHFELNAQGIYTFIFNAGHIKNNKANGIELSVSMTYNVF